MRRIGRLIFGLWFAAGGATALGAMPEPLPPPTEYCVFYDRIEKGPAIRLGFYAANVSTQEEAEAILAKSAEVENGAIVPRSCTVVAEAMLVPKLWAPVCTDFPAPETEYANVFLFKREVLLSSAKLGEVRARFAFGLCPPVKILTRKDAHGAVEVSPGDLVAIQLDRGPVHPCAGGPWPIDTLRYDREALRLVRYQVVENPDCPEGLVGCQREMDEFRFRVLGRFPTLVYLQMEPAPAWCQEKTPRDFWVVLR